MPQHVDPCKLDTGNEQHEDERQDNRKLNGVRPTANPRSGHCPAAVTNL